MTEERKEAIKNRATLILCAMLDAETCPNSLDITRAVDAAFDVEKRVEERQD